MTEMSPIVTVLDHEDHRLENLDARFTPVKSGGKPVIGVEVRVVDELDRDLPVGEVGEIIARGETRMKGYWKRAEVNDEVMRGGWMHT
ncbi:AMP-binding protein, partial [Acinetobacter baumannii]